MDKKKTLLQSLPKVDESFNRIVPQLAETIPHRIIKKCIKSGIDKQRSEILAGRTEHLIEDQQGWDSLFIQLIEERMAYNFRSVFNCTGVVVHTNLGRSLLPAEAGQQLVKASCSYSNLEFDLKTGKRGSRYSLVEEIICELTGAEAALVVNNNAAAVMIVLDTLAKAKEVIVSRGQLVEIGGSFRIPDVMAKSGAHLVEVGATNRTHYRDYENAITDNTSMLLRVHTSNFKVLGFTSEVSPEDMAKLAGENGLYTMEDLGSGSLIDLSSYGLAKEPTVQEVVKAGIDVITFSGDKLLGGPQAGIIVGKKDVIDRIKKNPMNRALRIDKFTLAALEAILRFYYDTPQALENVPTLRMLTSDAGEIKTRARKIIRRIKTRLDGACGVDLVATSSKVGGGAMPDCELDSWGVLLKPENISIHQLETSFRKLDVPIIGRVEDNAYLLDGRTIQDDEVIALSNELISFFLKRIVDRW